MREFLTTEQTAKVLRLHVKRVQALARAGRIPGVRVGRKWLFDREALLGSLQGGHRPRTEGTVEVSARNQLKGRVTGISLGGVMAELRVDLGGQELVAVITRSSVDRLRLAVGDDVLAVIKSTDVMVGKA
jgi:molybdopterin-binding protein